MGQTGQFFEIAISWPFDKQDRNRAFEIVKQVAESPVGLIATTDDDFVYNKGKFDNNWNNDFSVGVGTQHPLDFLVNNKDPRLLYFFQKNDYNSNVVQAYFTIKKRNAGFCRKECNF
ncbi:hypothetical protein NXU85_00035 [Phocaeicola vulgatus]|nr:hypothetical protein [Phocaeicola vulgatus]